MVSKWAESCSPGSVVSQPGDKRLERREEAQKGWERRGRGEQGHPKGQLLLWLMEGTWKKSGLGVEWCHDQPGP